MIMLKTDRLFLSKATLEDAPFIFELLNSPNWIEFIGDREINDLLDAEVYIQNALLNSYKSNGFGMYKITEKASARPLGLCGLLKRDYLDNPDIGFAILPEFEGNGFTTEAAIAVIEFSKSKLGINTITAITTEKNTNSQNVITKIGLEFVEKIKPEEEELLLYSN